MRLRFMILMLCCTPFSRPHAQSAEYVFSHLDFSNGLSSNHITCFFKDHQGFMWIGTLSGLDRYDGYQFRVFRHDPKDSTSIYDNYIEQIFEGPDGNMWVSSRGGRFNIYDFAHDRFDQNYGAYLRRLSLPEYLLLKIVHSADGYWFVYQDSGLFHYLKNGKIITLRHSENDPWSIDASSISAAEEDSAGYLWVIHQNGLLEKIDSRENKVVFRTKTLEKEFGNKPIFCYMYIDRQNVLWLFSSGVFKGVYTYQPETGETIHLSQDAKKGRLNSNVIYSVLQDEKGAIWLATDHNGVDIVSKDDWSVKYIGHVEDDPKSLGENSVPVMYRDYTGAIWLGSYKNGISYYHQNLIQFPQYRHQPFNPASLSYDDVNSFVEDPSGNIWIGSNGGGLIYFDRKRNSFRQYLHDPNNPNSLCNNIIVSLLQDKEGKLWIGTYFGGLDCYDGRQFTHYRHHDDQPSSLSEDRVMCVHEDQDRNIFVGTLAGGFDRLDRKKNVFTHYNMDQPNSIHNNYVASMTEDAQNNLWIGTAYGIDVLEKSSGRFIHYSSDTNKLSSDNVILLFRDSHQRMWAGTREGLNLFDPVKRSFQTFRTEDGLPDNNIRSIQEDRRHELWISTPNGISKVLVLPADGSGGAAVHIHCENYHEQDGLQGREFNEKSGMTARDGSIIFGGPNGFNIFNPENIVHNRTVPPILLTDLQVFNKSVRVGDTIGGHVLLQKDLSETREIRLKYSDNIFSLEFASLGFIANAKNKYAYTLEGFNKGWLTTDGSIRKATYTNLDAGEYVFKVTATNDDGEWYDRVATLKIIVSPPFWKTPFAYALYLLLSLAILLIARRMIIRRANTRFAVEHERRESRRMHEMDMMKIRFFTNMSHELRTPLSLILAPVEKLMSNPRQAYPEKQYEMIRRNAKRLLRLVNQLLDFRKMGINELRLHAVPGDILKFIKDASFSFIDLAEKKNISFLYTSDSDSLVTPFDHDKIESILFNLLSNAFKFTPENGTVSVEVHTDRSKKDETLLQIKVTDTGIGIPVDKQDRIFVRFFQADTPDTIVNQGSGIGLAITSEFVKMQQGTISVDSDPGMGSSFTVRLPFSELIGAQAVILPIDATEGEPVYLLPAGPGDPGTREGPLVHHNGKGNENGKENSYAQENGNGNRNGNPNGNGAKKHSILIVEDNEDFRFYLKDNLSAVYHIIEATDGKEGWRKALAMHPDLVVSDISMPLMNGTDLCKKIRADERTRQIPVILLTALAGEENELKSLQTGATDYITKPFNFEVLLSKVGNLLEYNETIKRTYQRQVKANTSNIEIESADDSFVQNVLQLIEKNMSNANFSVGELSTEFHASRSTIYKRILLLTGKTPVELIRHVRLKRAAELLEKSQMSVSEIAYTVGFNNPKYFAQHFKAEFELVPSAYREQSREQ